jgi:pyruvate kinase
MLEKMLHAGMNVVRLNMNHATHGWIREIFKRIRDAS